MEWDASEAAAFIVRGISEIKKKSGRGQQYTMLHFAEVFKGEVAVTLGFIAFRALSGIFVSSTSGDVKVVN